MEGTGAFGHTSIDRETTVIGYPRKHPSESSKLRLRNHISSTSEMIDSSTEHSSDEFLDIDRTSPEETFSALANEIRIETLLTMMRHPDATYSFSELYAAVDVDDPGQFNYHLDQLVGHFIHKTGDGYQLSHAGKDIVGAIYGGTYTADASIDHIPLGDICITCGGSLYLEYANEASRIRCEDCDRKSDSYPFPPQSLDQFNRHDLADTIGKWMDHYIRGLTAGFCPYCIGHIAGALRLDEDERLAGFPAYAEFTCDRCGISHKTPVTAPVHTHPIFRHFLVVHGLDIHTPIWWVLDTIGRPDTELLSTDPPRLLVTVSYQEDELTAIVDETATVATIEWEVNG